MMNQKVLSLLFYLLVMVNSSLGEEDIGKQQERMPPVLEFQPNNEVLTYEGSERIFLPCQIEGQQQESEGIESWWTRNGVNFTSSKRFQVGYDKHEKKHGLIITEAQEDDAGRYQCFVSNGAGTATSYSVELRFLEIPKSNDSTAEAFVGQQFNLTCKLPKNLENKEMTYWAQEAFGGEKNSKEVDEEERQIISLTDGTLWFSKVLAIDGTESNYGSYYYLIPGENNKRFEICKTTLKVKSASKPEDITTEPEQQYVSDENQVTKKNDAVKLFCIYGGKRSKITWEKDGKQLEPKDNIKVANSGKFVIIKLFTPDDAGNYSCKVHNNDELFKTHFFSVKIGKPYFIEAPKASNTSEGLPAKFQCVTADGNFGLQVNWTFNGKPIDESVLNGYYTILSQGGNSTLVIEKSEDFHIGNYGCNGSNTHGYVYKDVYLFLKPAQPVVIIGEKSKNITVTPNKPFNWTCAVQGMPKPAVTFMKGEEKLKTDDSYTIFEDEKVLQFNNLTSDDGGTYFCDAKNDKTPKGVRVEMNLFIQREPVPVPGPGFPWITVILVLLGLLLAAAAIIAWLIYDRRIRVDGIYHVKRQEAAVEQDPRIMDEANETLMPAPNAATLNRVRRANENGNARNGSVTVQMD